VASALKICLHWILGQVCAGMWTNSVIMKHISHCTTFIYGWAWNLIGYYYLVYGLGQIRNTAGDCLVINIIIYRGTGDCWRHLLNESHYFNGTSCNKTTRVFTWIWHPCRVLSLLCSCISFNISQMTEHRTSAEAARSSCSMPNRSSELEMLDWLEPGQLNVAYTHCADNSHCGGRWGCSLHDGGLSP